MTDQKTHFWETEESLERYAAVDYKLYDVESAFITEATLRLAKAPSDIDLLDLACGGRTSVPLDKLGYKLFCVDISKPLIESLKKKLPSVKAEVADITQYKFEENGYDIVLISHNSIDCIELYAARLALLKSLNTTLRAGGYLIFSSHFFNPLPTNKSVLTNILLNTPNFIKAYRQRGYYYKEKMANGEIVNLYASVPSLVSQELAESGFDILRCSRSVNFSDSWLLDSLKSLTSWEIHYLAQKK